MQVLRQLAEESLLQKERLESDEDKLLQAVQSKARQIAAASKLVQRRLEAFAAAYEQLLCGDAPEANVVRTGIFLEASNASEQIQKAVQLVAAILQVSALK